MKISNKNILYIFILFITASNITFGQLTNVGYAKTENQINIDNSFLKLRKKLSDIKYVENICFDNLKTEDFEIDELIYKEIEQANQRSNLLNISGVYPLLKLSNNENKDYIRDVLLNENNFSYAKYKNKTTLKNDLEAAFKNGIYTLILHSTINDYSIKSIAIANNKRIIWDNVYSSSNFKKADCGEPEELESTRPLNDQIQGCKRIRFKDVIENLLFFPFLDSRMEVDIEACWDCRGNFQPINSLVKKAHCDDCKLSGKIEGWGTNEIKVTRYAYTGDSGIEVDAEFKLLGGSITYKPSATDGTELECQSVIQAGNFDEQLCPPALQPIPTCKKDCQPDLNPDCPTQDINFNNNSISFSNLSISNNGDGDAAAYKIEYYLSTTQNVTNNSYSIGTQNMPTLLSNKSTIVPAASFSTANIPSNQYYVIIVVNSTNDSNYENNDCFTTATESINVVNPDPPVNPADPVTPAIITIITPNVNNTFAPGGNINIQWTDNISENVAIKLYGPTGVGYYAVTASTPSDGNYSYTIPSYMPVGQYRIRIESIINNTIYVYSNYFTINVPTPVATCDDDIQNGNETGEDCGGSCDPCVNITVTAPKGNNTYAQGDQINIQWTDNITENVAIKMQGLTSVAYYFVSSSTQSDGAHNYIIPTYIPDGQYRIEVESLDFYNKTNDYSDYFTIKASAPVLNCNEDCGGSCPPCKADLDITTCGTVSKSGNTITVNNVVIKNIGKATAGSTTLGFYLSTNTTIDKSDYRIRANYIPPLSVNGTNTKSFTLDISTITPKIPAGTYYVGMIADYQATLTESNENNNTCYDSSPKFTVTYGCKNRTAHNYEPNATYADNTKCETCDDDKINGDETGKNCGGTICDPCDNITVTSPNGNTYKPGDIINIKWTDDISENVLIKMYRGTDFWNVSTATLSDGAHNYTIPSYILPGQYRMYIESTTNSSVNDYSSYFTILEAPNCSDPNNCGGSCSPCKPDLDITNCGAVSKSGNTITVNNVVVKNIGKAIATQTKLGYYLSKDQTINSNDYLIGTSSVSTLAVNSTNTESISSIISYVSPKIPAGTYYVGMIADYQAALAETNENNNTCYDSSPKFTVTYGCRIPDAHNYNPNTTYHDIATCETCDDDEKNGDETGKDCGGTKCDPCGNITVTSPGVEGYSQGDLINIKWTDNITENVAIKMYGSTMGTQFYYVTTSTPSDGTHSYTIPSYIPNGQYRIKIESINNNTISDYGSYFTIKAPVSNCNDGIKNGNETGKDCGGSCLPCKADLTISSCGTVSKSGRVITVKDVVVKNIGKTTATSTVLAYYLSTNTIIDNSDILLGTQNINSLPINGTSIKSINIDIWSINPKIPAGTYYIGMLIDSQSTISELNESNNTCYDSSPKFTVTYGCRNVNAHNYNPDAIYHDITTCQNCLDGIKNGDETDKDCGGSCPTECIVLNGCEQRDRAALIALYNATDGLNWTNKWNLNLPMDQWRGVYFDAEGCVARLSLSNNNLKGNIPVEVGELSNLTLLRVGGNQLSGSIPVELGKLTELRELDLSSNQLTGNIYDIFDDIVNLERLALSGNQLTGGMPFGLSFLENLTSVNLSNNNFSGCFVPSLKNLCDQIPLNRILINYNNNFDVNWVDFCSGDNSGTCNDRLASENNTKIENHPNPFKNETTISYVLNKKRKVSVIIYNAVGEKIEVLVNNELQSKGKQDITFNGSNYAAGIYYYSLQRGDNVDFQKMILMK